MFIWTQSISLINKIDRNKQKFSGCVLYICADWYSCDKVTSQLQTTSIKRSLWCASKKSLIFVTCHWNLEKTSWKDKLSIFHYFPQWLPLIGIQKKLGMGSVHEVPAPMVTYQTTAAPLMTLNTVRVPVFDSKVLMKLFRFLVWNFY